MALDNNQETNQCPLHFRKQFGGKKQQEKVEIVIGNIGKRHRKKSI